MAKMGDSDGVAQERGGKTNKYKVGQKSLNPRRAQKTPRQGRTGGQCTP